MLLSSCVTRRMPTSPMLAWPGCSLQKYSPFSNQLTDTQTHARWHACTLQTPKFLNQKSDNIGHPNGEEVGRQRRVPIIELVFRATGERRSGQKSQWRATLKLLQNSRFLCAPKYLLWPLVEQEALELEKRRLQFTVWAGDLQAASPTVNTNKYKQQQTHPD